MAEHLKRGKDNSDLTTVDRAILRALATQGELVGHHLATLVEVPPKSIGSRMSSMVRRGLVKGRWAGSGNAWTLTLRGIQEAGR